MAEGFEVYHVPQQSRRDKLRVGGATAHAHTHTHNNNNNFHIAAPAPATAIGNLLPLYDDPSSFSDLLPQDFNHHHHNNNDDPLLPLNQTPPPFPSFYPLLPDHQPLSLELNLQQRYGASVAAPPIFSPPPIHDSSSLVLPLAGYASILKASRFLRPAQQLLEDLFDYAGGNANANPPSHKLSPDSAILVDPLLEALGGDVAAADHDPMSGDDGMEGRRKKSRLISMLDEVYRRYKQYYQQMQAVVTTFEYVAGLGNAAPYVNLAVKSMFKHFRFLKNAIADQLQFNKQQQQPYSPYCQRSIHNNAAFLDHQPVWRPQRGLPESAVTVLRAWLFEHFLHPYPTDTDKLMLANQTGLSRSQVSNWFINARVRLWKPMVEEIHMLETRQAQKSQQREPSGNALNNDHLSSTNESLKPDHNNNTNANASSSNHDHHHPLDLSNANIFPSHHPHAAAGAATLGGGPGSISLTLGLHQNHGQGGIALSEPFPINTAQHFNLGLEANGEGFVNEWF